MSGSTPLLLPYTFMVWTGKNFSITHQTSDNIIVAGQACTVAETTQSTQTLWWLLWCACLCMASCRHGEAKCQTSFLWDELKEGKHSDFSVSQYSSQSSVLSPKAPSTQKCLHHHKKRGAIINFGRRVVPHPPCIPDHLPSDYQLLGLLKNANEDIIMPMMGAV